MLKSVDFPILIRDFCLGCRWFVSILLPLCIGANNEWDKNWLIRNLIPFLSHKEFICDNVLFVPYLVSIRSIREVRPGKNTEVMKNKEIANIYSEDCTFSVIHGDEFESLDLIAVSPEEANIWVTGLNFLIGATKCK